MQWLKKDQAVCTNTIQSVAHGRDTLETWQCRPIPSVHQNERVPRPLPFPCIDKHRNEGNPSVLAYLYPVNEK